VFSHNETLEKIPVFLENALKQRRIQNAFGSYTPEPPFPMETGENGDVGPPNHDRRI
jgi:hypothetical protein